MIDTSIFLLIQPQFHERERGRERGGGGERTAVIQFYMPVYLIFFRAAAIHKKCQYAKYKIKYKWTKSIEYAEYRPRLLTVF